MSEVNIFQAEIYQGETWHLHLQLFDDNNMPILLTNYTARMDIRDKPGGLLHIALTSPAGGITIDAPTGVINVRLTAAQTTAMNFSKALYDLFIYSPAGTATPLIRGPVILERKITE